MLLTSYGHGCVKLCEKNELNPFTPLKKQIKTYMRPGKLQEKQTKP